MRREGGAVLINALVIVLALSAVAAALLTRAESARIRAEDAQGSAQIALYLDAVEALVPTLLHEPLDSGTVHLGQSWAGRDHVYQIDRGTVTARVRDLQGGLNVNWLVQPDDYVRETFARLFAELGVPVSLVDAIADFVRPGGPERSAAYQSRNPPTLPRGGAIRVLPQLRAVDGMTLAHYRAIAPHVAALSVDDSLNLNTASDAVLRAALAPFPVELVSETLARGPDEPLEGLRDFRNRLIEILETEDIEAYPMDRLTTGSTWFGARLSATLDGQTRVRQAVFMRRQTLPDSVDLAFRWTEYD